MPLYQNSVLNKFLNQQDTKALDKAYKKFTKYFKDPKIQNNIRSSKEEEYQGIFLTELFVNILGYTMKPNAKYNLVAEFKNEKNSKKADGAILKNDKAIGVIELKGTNIKDLEKVRQQAFDYKANQTGCIYVITSNFEKLRFYINNAVDFEEFDLFNLSAERFALLYLCLAQENILNNIPLNIKNASVVEEETITKDFYKDYSLFKRELFRDLVKQNMKNEVFRAELNAEDLDRANKNIKQRLFKKSQKLIDRFLFIFFAEDRGLLPPNSTHKILDQWNALKELDEIVPLYSRYKKYFSYLDLGRKGTPKSAEIFAYNGGLFKPDAILDSLIVDDELLFKHTKKLSDYDFESQVDVNILGHIFENSLNEIESVNAEIEGTDFDKQKTKRKKDGVFYTPKYITKYIVDNTVSKLCEEKKIEFNITGEDFNPKRQKETKKKLLESLENYREWLLQITICDPACGSGAFLNQALDFLIKEHTYIDELQTSLLGGGFIFPEIENTVLENNIFGVDLNEESVEIAKLSLWLRTAQPRRKLNSLNNNIKCGNSLIESKAVAGDKAFTWEDEFPQVFAKGGFDVIIGNPPYVSTKEIIDREKIYLKNKYSTAVGQFDLYGIFMEKGLYLLKNKGVFSFITSSTFIANKDFLELRKFLLNKTQIYEILNLGETVFKDANLDVAILSYAKRKITTDIKVNRNREEFDTNHQNYISQKYYINEINNYEFKINCTKKDFQLLNKLFTNRIPMGKILDLPRGVEIGSNSDMISDSKIDENFEPIIYGRNISKYKIEFNNQFIQFNHNNKSKFKDYEIYKKPKLLIQRIRNLSLKNRIVASFDNEGFICTNTLRIGVLKNNIKFDLKTILGILNSKLINYVFLKYFLNKDIYSYQLQQIPIEKFGSDDSNSLFTKLVDVMSNSTQDLSLKSLNFQTYLQQKFSIQKLTKKLQNWHELEFGEFINEVNKAIKKTNKERIAEDLAPVNTLSTTDEMDWMEVFDTKKAEVLELKAAIDKTDAAIDAMVYELYGLTDEEIAIVESS